VACGLATAVGAGVMVPRCGWMCRACRLGSAWLGLDCLGLRLPGREYAGLGVTRVLRSVVLARTRVRDGGGLGGVGEQECTGTAILTVHGWRCSLRS